MLNTSKLRRNLSLTVICATALLLAACGSQVDCNSSKVKENAIEIIQSHLNNALWYREIHGALSGSPEFTSVKTLSKNDELKQAQCNAKYSFTYNGKLREIDTAYEIAYLEDKGETEVKVSVSDVIGGVMGMVMAERPIKNGVEKIMDPKTGNLLHQIGWKNGVQDGVEEVYNPVLKKLIGQLNVSNGIKTGSEKWWNADGSVVLIDLNWIDGKATGYEKRYSTSGDKLLTDLVWKDGKASGFQTTGNLGLRYDEYRVKDGLYDGEHREYDTSSNTGRVYLYKIDNYKAGKLDGLSQEFNEAGKVTSESSYKNGIEEPMAARSIPSSARPDACLDSKVASYHKEQGDDAMISNDMITEWKNSCDAR